MSRFDVSTRLSTVVPRCKSLIHAPNLSSFDSLQQEPGVLETRMNQRAGTGVPRGAPESVKPANRETSKASKNKDRETLGPG